MPRQRKPKPVEELNLHWDKRDDIVEVYSAMLGCPVPEGEAPDKTSGDKTSPDVLSPDITSSIPPPSLATPAEAGAAFSLAPTPTARPRKIYRCNLAQDGHSRTEEDLYQILWKAGQPVAPGDDSCRMAQVGQPQLAAALRLAERNLPAVLSRLIEKLSIEEVQSFSRQQRTARVFRVYSYRAILDRRKAAGLEWIVKDRGVRFVQPSGDVLSGDVFAISSPDVMPPKSKTSGDKTSETSGDKTSPLLLLVNKSFRESSTTTAPSAPTPIVQALAETLGRADDNAALRIALGCREYAPDATDQEIAQFIRAEATRILRLRNVDNPMGLLIRHLPRCFEGESFRQFRQAESLRQSSDRVRRQEFAAELSRLLDDPNASEQDKQWARKVLAEQPPERG